MSSPTNGAPYTHRVMVETLVNGIPRRIHVWQNEGRTFISFPATMTEAEATALVAHGLGTLQTVDVSALFREPSGKRRRFIDSAED